MTHPQVPVAYCAITPYINGTDATALVTGFIMNPDGTLVQLGGSGSYQFTIQIPFEYGMSVNDLADAVLPEIRRAYGQPDLHARVNFLPFV